MKRPFDLKAALSGEPIQYRDLCTCYFLRVSQNHRRKGITTLWFSRVGEASDHIETTLDGDVLDCTDGGVTRVTMAPRKVKKTVWVNFYDDGTAYYWPSEKAANDAKSCDGSCMVVAIPVEIEVEE